MARVEPMLLVDDDRRCVDANDAACLFLRLPRDVVRRLRIDDLIGAELRDSIDALWCEFLARDRSPRPPRARPWSLRMPDGTRVTVDVSGTPHFRPGRHLGILRFPPAQRRDERVDRDADAPAGGVLTKRERQILTLVAIGDTGVYIAEQLCVSPATVATHVTNALIKLGAKNRAHGIAIALQTGELEGGVTPSNVRPVRALDRETEDRRRDRRSHDGTADEGATAARSPNA